MDPNGKVALLTGAANGIGLAYARILLTNGANVMLSDIDTTQGEKVTKQFQSEFGEKRVTFFKCDVTVSEEFQELFKQTVAVFNGIHILINNAGIMNDGKWRTEIAINITAVVEGTLTACKYMKKSEGGVIINISSILGLQPFPGCPIYTGSKHFVIGFSRSFGDKFHYEKYGVRVLTMCPGVTDTTLISEAHTRQLEPDISKLCGDELAALPPQKVDNVAEGLLHMIREAKNGTVWVSEGGKPVYQVQIPDRLTLKV